MSKKEFKEPMYKESKEKIDLSNIQKIRDKRGITQVKLSMAVGVSQQSITFYETNTRYPSLPTLIKIADVLKTSIDSVIGRNDTISKYYDLSDNDKVTVNKLIESLSNKATNK